MLLSAIDDSFARFHFLWACQDRVERTHRDTICKRGGAGVSLADSTKNLGKMAYRFINATRLPTCHTSQDCGSVAAGLYRSEDLPPIKGSSHAFVQPGSADGDVKSRQETALRLPLSEPDRWVHAL